MIIIVIIVIIIIIIVVVVVVVGNISKSESDDCSRLLLPMTIDNRQQWGSSSTGSRSLFLP